MGEIIKRPDTLKTQAVEWILKLMVAGKLKPDEIYSASYFAQVLGTSRTPTREALLQLTAEGYFISHLGRGFKVREFTEKEIVDFFETRKLIEIHIIKNVQDRLDEGITDFLEDNLKKMIKSADNEDIYQFLDMDKAFHMRLARLYDNSQLTSIMENIRNLMTIMGERALSELKRFSEVIAEHRLIIDTLKEKDFKKAVSAMSNHINVTEKVVLGKIIKS